MYFTPGQNNSLIQHDDYNIIPTRPLIGAGAGVREILCVLLPAWPLPLPSLKPEAWAQAYGFTLFAAPLVRTADCHPTTRQAPPLRQLLNRLRSEQALLCHPAQPRGARGNLTGCLRRRSCRSHLAGCGAKAGSARRGATSRPEPRQLLRVRAAITHRSRRSRQRASSARQCCCRWSCCATGR